MDSLVERLRAFAQGCRGSMWQSRDETIRLMDLAADELTRLTAENARLRGALGEICRDSNPDWTEKRTYPTDVLDDIHKIAVDAYYAPTAALNELDRI